MKIYIAGPYSADTMAQREVNVIEAMSIGIKLIQIGHDPYIPHLTHFLDQLAKTMDIEIPYEWYVKYDLHWLAVCDALYLIGESPGALYELRVMEMLLRPIYHNLADIPTIP